MALQSKINLKNKQKVFTENIQCYTVTAMDAQAKHPLLTPALQLKGLAPTGLSNGESFVERVYTAYFVAAFNY